MKKLKLGVYVICLFLLFSNFSYAYLSPNIISILNPKVISHGSVKDEKLVAITFDDGPDTRFTPTVLDTLKKYNAKATFFVVGQNVEKHSDIIKREIKEGHQVENHTYTHPDLKKCNSLETMTEILKAQEAIEKVTKKKTHFFRPPKKLFDNETIDIAELYRYKTVLWGVCTEHKACKTPEEMADRVVKKAKPGIIILAHDGRLDRTKTVEALPLILKGYQEKGYKFVTLDELFSHQAKK